MTSCLLLTVMKPLKIGLLLTLLHSERPKLHTILAFLSAIGLRKEFASARVNAFL